MSLKQNGPCMSGITHGPREMLLAKSSSPKNRVRPDPRQMSSAIREMRLRHLLERLDKAAASVEFMLYDEPDEARALWDVEEAISEAAEWVEALTEIREGNR
jgi:hypothetical protein